MPYYYGYGFGIDPLYLLVVLVCTVLGLAAQSYINSTYKTWSKVRSDGDTGATVARRMLDANGQPVSFDLLGHCADRYGVSLTAAALRWTEIAPNRAILVARRDDHMLWAKSNKAAFRSGAYFATRKNTIELPHDALAHSYNAFDSADTRTGRAQSWFAREPASMPITEMTRVAGQYDYTLTLLLLPEAEWQGARHYDEKPEEDTYDRFIRNGQYPVR